MCALVNSSSFSQSSPHVSSSTRWDSHVFPFGPATAMYSPQVVEESIISAVLEIAEKTVDQADDALVVAHGGDADVRDLSITAIQMSQGSGGSGMGQLSTLAQTHGGRSDGCAFSDNRVKLQNDSRDHVTLPNTSQSQCPPRSLSAATIRSTFGSPERASHVRV
jgi:hypothetical protein